MQNPELCLLAEGLILSASDVLRQLRSLTDRFATESISTPAELCHLREAVSAHRKLLETYYEAEAVPLTTLKQGRALQGFYSELLLSERLLQQLNETVQAIHGGFHVGPGPEIHRSSEDDPSAVKEVPSTTLKARWSFHRDQVGKLHKEIRDVCSRCLGEMLLMNAYVIILLWDLRWACSTR